MNYKDMAVINERKLKDRRKNKRIRRTRLHSVFTSNRQF